LLAEKENLYEEDDKMKKPILSLFLVFIVLNFILAGTAFAVQKRSRAKGPTDEKIKLDVRGPRSCHPEGIDET
jgi:hypothetical protein